MGDQVITPSSSDTATTEVPTWAAEPEVTAPSGSPREEAIAEVLRSALAQGHSDEALAGILRKVLAGASPQSALDAPDTVEVAPAPSYDAIEDDVPQNTADAVTDTFATGTVTAPESTTDDAAAESAVENVRLRVRDHGTAGRRGPRSRDDRDPIGRRGGRWSRSSRSPRSRRPCSTSPCWTNPVFEEPVVEEPVFAPVADPTTDVLPAYETFDAPAVDVSDVDVPAHETPAAGVPMFEVPVYEIRPDEQPVEPFGALPPATPSPAWVAAPTSMWGPPTMSATLWGEPVRPGAAASTPIWAEVGTPSPTDPVDAALFEERVEIPAEPTLDGTESSIADVTDVEETAVEVDALGRGADGWSMTRSPRTPGWRSRWSRRRSSRSPRPNSPAPPATRRR